MFGFAIEPTMVNKENALAGRSIPVLPNPQPHTVLGTQLLVSPGDGEQVIYLAAGCYWGVEEMMWQHAGVKATAVGFMGGYTPNPTYDEVCTGRTGHAETVRVVLNDDVLPSVLKLFWESHDPTSLNRQGNDRGTQYRSAIYYTTDEQRELAEKSKAAYNQVLAEAGKGEIVTEIVNANDAGEFYLAEDNHQQYLDKNPDGYRCHAITGLPCPMPGAGPLGDVKKKPRNFI